MEPADNPKQNNRREVIAQCYFMVKISCWARSHQERIVE